MNTTQAQPGTNGDVNINNVADILEEEVTVGYRPVMPLESLWLSGADMPQITLRRDLEFMQMHPVVMTALEYYKSGIYGAEFWGGPDHINKDNLEGKPISTNSQVADFVLSHVEKFWQNGMPLLQEGYAYGWSAGEHIYKEAAGYMTWSRLKDFHPNDSFILSLGYNPIGVRVKNIRDKQPVDLWYASGAIPAKACWYPHRPRFNSHYGRSQLMGAWRPWRRLGWRDAVEQVIDAAVYRAGYRGPIVRHPMEDMQTAKTGIPATQPDSAGNPRRNARDVARQLVEWAKAGAGFTLSSAKYSPAMGGGDKWSIEWPEHVMDVRPLIEAAKYLEEQIMLGVGVPPELVRAAGTGTGYSGRSIPREAFLERQQVVAEAMLKLFIDQVVRPLVLWNFGDIPFNICCRSLLTSQAEAKQGGMQPGGPINFNRSDAAKRAWRLRKINQPPQEQQPTQTPRVNQTSPMPAMSLEANEKVLQIVRNVLSRVA